MRSVVSIRAQRRVPSWLMGLAILTLSGCANLEAVRQFAKTSAATADYPRIVADYANSPKQQMLYQPASQAEKLQQQAKLRAEQKIALEAAQTVLVQYMSALGDLAADDLPNVDDEIDGLGKALEKAKFVGDADAKVNTETATAAGNIAKILTRAVLDGWRKCKVKELIRETDPHIQKLVAGLTEVVDKDFRQSLGVEEEAIKKPFKAWGAAASSMGDSDAAPRVADILLQDRLSAFEQRRAKLESYIKALGAIGKGHAELKANVEKLDGDQAKALLKGYINDLQDLYKFIKELSN